MNNLINETIGIGTGKNMLFKNFARMPSLIYSPIKGTTASTKSPSLHVYRRNNSTQILD